jgi:uncharacterized protein (DUF305 family)
MRFRLLVVTSSLALAMSLTACSSSSETDTAANASTDAAAVASEAVAGGVNAAFNEADVEFAQNMIPHHQQAVEMAVIALDDARGASAGVKELATRIQGAQQPEIDLMGGWLKAWGKEGAPSTEMEGMDHSSMDHSAMEGMEGMEGMMSAEEMKSLESATGQGFDTAWLEMMVRHHEGAVVMAKAVQADGSSVEAKTLAGKIIGAQEAEIAEMNTALGK